MTASARRIELQGGTLSVRVDSADWDLDELCGFASRNNPKRRFLFVSKVLGKHIPARPSTMERAYGDLADKIRLMRPEGPVVCVALCETATGLGEGVWEALVRGGNPALFVHSTRTEFDAPLAFRFEEAHSHAVDHLLYLPSDPVARGMFDHARTLVLVDDEISTGRTMREIAKAFHARDPSLRRVVVVTLTDWVSQEVWDRLWEGFPLEVVRTSLLRGSYEFTADPDHRPRAGATVASSTSQTAAVLVPRGPRFGIVEPSRVPSHWIAEMDFPNGATVLVLGTGEFHHIPFLFARHLESRGVDVHYQSSTRSPILAGHAIECVLGFQDHHGEGIPNFLYNVLPGQYDRVVACYEVVGELPRSHGLPAMLDAHLLRLAVP